jgi:hypothetical protein
MSRYAAGGAFWRARWGARTETIPQGEYFKLALCHAKTGASG